MTDISVGQQHGIPAARATMVFTLDGETTDLPARDVAWISFAMVAGTMIALLLA